MTTPAAPSRIWLKGALVLVATFAVGAVAGAAADHLVHRRSLAGPRGRGPFQEFKQLGLTPAQCQAVDSVFQRGRPRIAAVLQEVEPRMRAVTDSIRAEVRTVLTPEQQARFDSLPAPKKFLGRGFPAGPGPGAKRDGPGGRPRPPSLCG